MTGALVVVGTPIGNLGDLSPRASQALATADLVCCEDTRRTGRLLELTGIGRRPLARVDDVTEAGMAAEVVERVGRGERVVLVTDAGMPAVADPGERLVAAVVAAGLAVEVVPGPSSPIVALAVSGLPSGRFVVEGFLPRKGAVRAERLAEVAAERRTVVLLEAPHRVARTMADLLAACGAERRVVLARELTKLHEEVWRGTLAEAVDDPVTTDPRGEYVVVLDGAPAPADPSDDDVVAALAAARAGGTSTRDAVDAVAAALGVPRRRVYRLATMATD